MSNMYERFLLAKEQDYHCHLSALARDARRWTRYIYQRDTICPNGASAMNIDFCFLREMAPRHYLQTLERPGLISSALEVRKILPSNLLSIIIYIGQSILKCIS
jgi:hypothetical protein